MPKVHFIKDFGSIREHQDMRIGSSVHDGRLAPAASAEIRTMMQRYLPPSEKKAFFDDSASRLIRLISIPLLK